MSDALLKQNNYVNINGMPYEKIAEVVTTVNQGAVDITGLNIVKGETILIEIDLLTIGGVTGYLHTNANYTVEDCYTQYFLSNGATQATGRLNQPYIPLATAVARSRHELFMGLSSGGQIVYTGTVQAAYGTSAPVSYRLSGATNLTYTAITSIRVASQSQQLAAGTIIKIYKLSAELISDIIVASPTMQVDFTELNIQKDSEYFLVSNLISAGTSSRLTIHANDDLTETNYWTQTWKAYGGSILATQPNSPWISEVSSSNHSLSYTYLKLLNNGQFSFTSRASVELLSASVSCGDYVGAKTAALTSITKLSVKGWTTNAIGTNSRFQLYRLK